MSQTIVFLGGDNRQKYIMQHLSSLPFIYNNYSTIDLIYPKSDTLDTILNAVNKANVLIAPLPIAADGLNIKITTSHQNQANISIPFKDIVNELPYKSIVFAGGFSENMTAQMSIKNIKYYDYLKCECVQTKNAVATAEGTIMKAIEESIINMQGSNCLVLGYGKCAKVLAKKLRALDANVTICARAQESLCEASSWGYKTVHLNGLIKSISNYDFIFNTIPTVILNQEVINNISIDTVIIDIASVPGGIDYEYASKKNIKAFHYLGIPGKISPKTSGYILGEFIINHLEVICVN